MKYVLKALFGSYAWLMVLGKLVSSALAIWLETSLFILIPKAVETKVFPMWHFTMYAIGILCCKFVERACLNYRFTLTTKLQQQLIYKVTSLDVNFHTTFSGAEITSARDNILPLTATIRIILSVVEGLIRVSIYSIRIIMEVKNFLPVLLVLYGFIIIITVVTNIPYNKYEKIAVAAKHRQNTLFEELTAGFQDIFLIPGKLNALRSVLIKDSEEKEVSFRKRDAIDGLSISGLSAMYYIGIFILFQYNTTPDILLVLIAWFGNVIDPIVNVILELPEVAAYKASLPGLLKILEYEPAEKSEESGKLELNSFKSGISIKDLSFGYGDSDSVLRGISMNIHKGTKIGIVGASGGGKSTLLKILCGFYNYSGSVSIDGIKLSDIDNRSIGNIVGYIPQDPAIFNGTIKYNILYGTNGTDDVRLVEACKKANIYEFIISTEKGFETEVGPNGLKLSGGQKQRIALARMFLRNPQVLLLDEATSALDNISEKKVTDTLAASDTTVIQVAHRLTTVKGCDCIYVIDNHTVVEYGTHDELLRKEGMYNKLWNQQITE